MTVNQLMAATSTSEVCCSGSEISLLAASDAELLAGLFKALADPTRVRLLRHLSESEDATACACHLPDALGISQPTLSFHMRKLHQSGLVKREKRGRWVHWTVQEDAVAMVRDFLIVPSA